MATQETIDTATEAAPEPKSAIETADSLTAKLAASAETAAAELEEARKTHEARERDLASATAAREEAEEAFAADSLPWAAVNEAIDAENRARVLMNTARRALARAASTKDAAERAAALGELDRCRAIAGWDGLLERAMPHAERVAVLTSQLAAAIDALEELREEQWSALKRGRELTKQLGVTYDLPPKVGELYGRAVVRLVCAHAGVAPEIRPWAGPYVTSASENGGFGQVGTSASQIATDAKLPQFVAGKGHKPVNTREATRDLRLVEEGLRGRWREAVLGLGGLVPPDPVLPFQPSRDDSLVDGEIIERYLEWRASELGDEFERPPLAACDVDGAEVVVTLNDTVFRTPFIAEGGEIRFGPPYVDRGSWRDARQAAARPRPTT